MENQILIAPLLNLFTPKHHIACSIIACWAMMHIWSESLNAHNGSLHWTPPTQARNQSPQFSAMQWKIVAVFYCYLQIRNTIRCINKEALKMIGKKKQTIFFLSKIAVKLFLLSSICQLVSANIYMNRRLWGHSITT